MLKMKFCKKKEDENEDGNNNEEKRWRRRWYCANQPTLCSLHHKFVLVLVE
jgi:hypothetical protein